MANSNRFIIPLIATLSLISNATGTQHKTPSREYRNLRMADQAIVTSLAVARSAQGQHLCSNNKLACVGPDKAELGLALIGSTNTSASRSALVNLLAYRLDGSVDEEYRCYVLNAGTAIERDLVQVHPGSLEARCRSELHKLIRTRMESFDGLNEDAVCADTDTIKAKAAQLANGITKGIRCGPDDF